MGWLTYYFALPQSNITQVLNSGLKGDFLISFAHFNHSDRVIASTVEMVRKINAGGNKVMLDSGAFTNERKPGAVKLEQYCEFLKSESKHFSEYITLDDTRFREGTFKNYAAMLKLGFSPLFVDHLRKPDDKRLVSVYRKVQKLCLSAWGSDPSTHRRNADREKEEQAAKERAQKSKLAPGDGDNDNIEINLPEVLKKKIDCARECKTDLHLLAVGSLAKFLPYLDTIKSVDSAVVFRCVGYGQIVHCVEKDVGGLKLPFLQRCAHPDCRTDTHQKLTPECLGKLKAFVKGRSFTTRNNAYRAFCFSEISKYITALNKLDPKAIMTAFQKSREEKTKKSETSFFWFDEQLVDGWPFGDGAVPAQGLPDVSDVVCKLDMAGGEVIIEGDDGPVRVTCTPVEQKSEETDAAVRLLPVEKADEDRNIVFGVVLEPDSVDAQGDTIDPEEIERASHLWLARFQDRGLQHEKIVNSKVEIYESYISPTDLTLGGQKVKKGTWLLMLHVLDKDLWSEIKSGKFTGFSMGGFARRVRT